jgi:hypothetical protein
MKKLLLAFVSFSLGALSIVMGIWIGLWAFFLDMAVLPDDTKWLLRTSGYALTVLALAYWVPLSKIRTPKGLALLGLVSVAAALSYAAIYTRAEINDPFRSENEFGAAFPFRTAGEMCLLQILRLSFNWISRIQMRNQSTDPTSSSGTAGAGHQPRHP